MHRRAVAAALACAVAALSALVRVQPAYAADDAAAQLAQKYAPIVVVREQSGPCEPGEPYVPTAVETVLGNPDVTLIGPDGTSYDAPTAQDLAGKGDGWYLDLPGNPLDPGCDYDRWFRETAAGKPSTVYARVTTDPSAPDKLVLQYWLFWVYNDWNDKHEGDWEMIQLVFPARTPAEALGVEPESTAFAQHEGSEVALWDDPKVHRDGDRIAVYPGQGSHAAYYTRPAAAGPRLAGDADRAGGLRLRAALDGAGADHLAAGAGGDPGAACAYLRVPAPVGDADAGPHRAAGARRQRADAACRAGRHGLARGHHLAGRPGL